MILALTAASSGNRAMRRIQWFELHDQSWFPAFLRDQVTDALQAILQLGGFYRSIAGRLQRALEESGATQVLDLCSGAGGPWLALYKAFDRPPSRMVSITLSDKFPNGPAFRRAQSVSNGKIAYHAAPVNVTDVPQDLAGFRTVFNAFHHFSPPEAHAMLLDAVEQRRGIGIFEVPGRHLTTLLLTCTVPLAALLVTPFLRPFRWSRLMWTYLIPVVPLVLLFDGIVSCLRVYSPSELVELTGHLSSSNVYEWEIGEERSGWLPITYLIGRPRRAEQARAASGSARI
jgi:hypothetical protein